jgi:hypothetical protein
VRPGVVGERGTAAARTRPCVRAARTSGSQTYVYKDLTMKLCKLFLASVGAALLLGALVAGASGRSFEVSNQRLRATFRRVEFVLPFGATTCEIILEGSLHNRVIAKTLGSLIGYITTARLGPCASGTATILALTLPWHIRYSGFQGNLPDINSIITHVIEVAFDVREPFGIHCLARSTTTEPVIANFHREIVTHEILTAELRGSIRAGMECSGAAGSLRSDRGVVSVSNAATRIAVSLI